MKITKEQLKQLIKEELNERRKFVDDRTMNLNSKTIDKVVNILNDEFGVLGALEVLDEIRETFLGYLKKSRG